MDSTAAVTSRVPPNGPGEESRDQPDAPGASCRVRWVLYPKGSRSGPCRPSQKWTSSAERSSRPPSTAHPTTRFMDLSIPPFRAISRPPIQHIRIAAGRIDDMREAERCAALACKLNHFVQCCLRRMAPVHRHQDSLVRRLLPNDRSRRLLQARLLNSTPSPARPAPLPQVRPLSSLLPSIRTPLGH
jgi:hypothetical protein